MKISWSRGTHQNDGNRQDNPLRYLPSFSNTPVMVLEALEGPESGRLAQNDFFHQFSENKKLGAEIFLMILAETKIPGRWEPVRTRLLL